MSYTMPRRQNLRRERRRRGWTVDETVEQIHRMAAEKGIPLGVLELDVRQYKRWESGEVEKPRLQNIWLLAETFQLPPERLDLPPIPGFDLAPAGRAPQQVVEPSGPVPGLVDSDDVKRREFARLLALTGAVAGGLDLERMAAMLVAGARADEPALDDLETLTGDLIRREATLTPHSLLPAVRGHLHGLRDVLVWATPDLAPRAYSLAGQTALLAGYLELKLERREEADAYWSLATRFGDMAGDIRLRTAVLVLQGLRWSEADDLPRSVVLLDHAASLLGAAPDPALAAHVLTYRASSNAEAGQADLTRAAQALRDLDAVQSHLSRMEPDDGSVYIAESVKGEAVHERAESFLSMNRAREAAAELDVLLASADHASKSWRADIVRALALAHAKLGDADHACELLSRSLLLAVEASAPRSVTKIRNARTRWLSDLDGPAIRELDERLHAVWAGSQGVLPAHNA
jgi:transcriptional regulator with XRE-family HTH domain